MNRTVIHELIDMSKRLEGLPRHTSTHAAGVISPKAVDEYVPLSRAQGRLHCHPVYDDNTGGAWPSEDGFSWPSGR